MIIHGYTEVYFKIAFTRTASARHSQGVASEVRSGARLTITISFCIYFSLYCFFLLLWQNYTRNTNKNRPLLHKNITYIQTKNEYCNLIKMLYPDVYFHF